VAEDDLVVMELHYPDRIGENFHLRFNSAQRWYYLANMEANEVLLFKSFDSAVDGRAVRTPHAAFDLPDQDRAPARESVEVRMLVEF
jgi:hypothetical protein